jgi:dephospho-CoA kinase
VGAILSEHQIPVIDADAVYHGLLVPPSPCLDALRERFGDAVFTPDGLLNRRALGEIVFSDPNALKDLNRIAHGYVMEEIRNQLKLLQKRNIPVAVIDAPQLFEAEADKDCNLIVSVLADKRIRLERIMARDGIDAEAALRRMEAQKNDEFFKAHYDYVLENNGNPDLLRPKIQKILLETGVLTP